MPAMAAPAAPPPLTAARPPRPCPPPLRPAPASRPQRPRRTTEVNPIRRSSQEEQSLHDTFVLYVRALAATTKPIPLIWMEHSYARAGSGAGRCCAGTRLLLVRQAPRCPDCHTENVKDDELIDVDTVENDPAPPLKLDEIPYWEKALVECDMTPEEDDLKTNWEERLHSLAWNSAQSTLLDEALTIIHYTRAGLLTAGHAGARRAAARGGGARALRALLATPQTRWQPCLAQWLHNALTEHLPTPLLACYREIMLTMKSKVPVLVEKMTIGHPLTGRIQGAENGATGPTIASASTPSDPTAPILLLVPSGRGRRDARWAERLRAVAQVHIVHSHQSSWSPSLPLTMCLTQLISSTKIRIETLRVDNPHRPIVLVGCGAGAAIAAQLAVNTPGVAGLVCLALPLLTADGPRGGPDDCLLDLPCPVLFVIGQNASQSSQQDAESLRCKLKVKSRLVVAGGADELLRLPRLKRQLEGVTQRMLECAIVDEVSSFLSFLLRREDEGEACSSPESYGGLDGDDHIHIGSSISHNPRRDSLAMRRRGSSPSAHEPKKKKIRHRPIKVVSPLKSRGTSLYDLNNPPPEGTTISIADIHNHKFAFNDDSKSLNSSIQTQKKSEPASFIQITNSRLTKSIVTGNGSYETASKSNSGIKVLENISFNNTSLANLKGITGISGSGSTPLVINPRRIQRISQTSANKQGPQSSGVANIMDLPIVFADDPKSGDNDSKSTNQSSAMKTIIINKQQVIPSSSNSSSIETTQITLPSSSQQTSPRSLVQLKIPPNSQSSNKGVSTNLVKYAKVILASRPSEAGKGTNDNDPKGQLGNKPVIQLKGKGSTLTTFKVLPGNIFQKGTNVFSPKQRLIIKRAVVPSGLNVNQATQGDGKKLIDNPKVDGESLRKNSTNDSAIEAAVASITGNYMKDMLGHFD